MGCLVGGGNLKKEGKSCWRRYSSGWRTLSQLAVAPELVESTSLEKLGEGTLLFCPLFNEKNCKNETSLAYKTVNNWANTLDVQFLSN